MAASPRPVPAETYADGSPLDTVHYLECKLILKPDRFTAADVFLEFGRIVAETAMRCGVGYAGKNVVLQPELREILFLDTAGFQLYNNAFILRRRIPYVNGFPEEDPEFVFKFRNPDLRTAARVDMRPGIAGRYRIKFKAEALPLKDRVGGYRLLYSHNVEFNQSQAPEGDQTAMATLAEMLPPLAALATDPSDHVALVNQTFVEEVLQDLGMLDFGKGVTAESNIAIWRDRATHRRLCGEFSFQAKFKRQDDQHEKAMARCQGFFVELQQTARTWLSLGTTKTGLVYRLKGNPPQAHE